MASPLRPHPLFLGASLATPILLCRVWHFQLSIFAMSPSVLFWQKLVALMFPNLLKNALEMRRVSKPFPEFVRPLTMKNTLSSVSPDTALARDLST